jgi:hypothetical protein
MTDLATQPAEIHFTLEIKRAATGATEVYQMTGRIRPPIEEKLNNVSNSQHSSEKRCD